MATITKTEVTKTKSAVLDSPYFSKSMRGFVMGAMVTLFAGIILAAYLAPFLYMTLTSFKTKGQIVDSATGSILPVTVQTYDYEGEQVELLMVPLEDGLRELAIIDKGRNGSV